MVLEGLKSKTYKTGIVENEGVSYFTPNPVSAFPPPFFSFVLHIFLPTFPFHIVFRGSCHLLMRFDRPVRVKGKN